MRDERNEVEKVISKFEQKSGLIGVSKEVQERTNGSVYKLLVAQPTERLFDLLEQSRMEAHETGSEEEPPLITLKKHSSGNLLVRAEGRAFLQSLSETLNINRYSFERDFEARYTPSVAGAESKITAAANHVVYGRRGAGKSMLLLYALHFRENLGGPSIWIDLQVYSQRNDDEAIADILVELIEQVSELAQTPSEYTEILATLKRPGINFSEIKRIAPSIRRAIGKFARDRGDLFIFLDDFHVVAKPLQPLILDALYSIARGNRIFLKLSAIETLTRTYDAKVHVGLDIPHDAQVITLDYNLTTPDKAISHIEAILDAQATYSGLPSIRRICTSNDVLPRLTWVAAGVPRDALYLFSQAISKAAQVGRNRVAVSDVNQAASETLSIKLKDLETDISSNENEKLDALIERIRIFCVTIKRTNAFLVEIRSQDPLFNDTRTLVDLRLLHIISEGVTIGDAGRKYLALVLDYGFYTGVRAAKSVDLFNKQSERVSRQQLRRLPVFRSEA